MRKIGRSGCPINLTLEMIGDRWSLIVIRDVMFGNRRHYGDLLRLSDEGIASNILADRVARLVSTGLLSRTDDPSHKQKAIYSLTEASIQFDSYHSEHEDGLVRGTAEAGRGAEVFH